MPNNEFIIDLAHPSTSAAAEAVLFPFDRYAIPLRKGLEMDLLASKPTRAPYNPVLVRGKPGAPDSFRIGYYGTVIEIDGRFHMWYIGDGDRDEVDQEASTPYRHILYAVSDDGLRWERPNLGLVEYNGSRNNNLVQTNMEPMIARACTVLHDPEDPDPQRRFKLFIEGNKNRGHVAFSPDGLTWQPSAFNPVTRVLIEQTGLIKRDGMYFVIGQTGGRVNGGFTHRTLIAFMSPDFEHWTDVPILGFRRDPLPPRDVCPNFHCGPQVHLGAGFWDRGNVLIGLYGQWNADPADPDRRCMKMNLGLVTSQDGMHFDEPVPDFKMINSVEENWALCAMGSSPRITQGQGFINHGERTITYYGHWGKDGNKEIRAAVWDRDRLGRYAVSRHPVEGQFPAPREVLEGPDPADWLPCLMTCPLAMPDRGGRVFLNCGNLSKMSDLRVSVVDRRFNPIAGYSLDECAAVQADGFRIPVRWRRGDRIQHAGPIRLRIQWGGMRFEDPILYAVYVAGG